MLAQKKKSNSKKIKNYVLLFGFVFSLCSCADCEKFNEQNVFPREGALKIDTIYHKWGDRAYTASSGRGISLLFNKTDFLIQPKIGDSLVKRKGEAEYTLYTDDSIYVQRFDCTKERGIIISSTKRNPSTPQQH